jgi:hypothetical protein
MAFKKKGKSSPVAKAGEVPDDLVGRRYDSFTPQERETVRTHRRINKCCFICGSGDHVKTGCPRYRAPPQQEAPSPPNVPATAAPDSAWGHDTSVTHDPWGMSTADLTANTSLSQTQFATRSKGKAPARPHRGIAIAEENEVPYELVGVTYRDMTKEERDAVYQFRIRTKRCTSCASKDHKKWDCPTRKNRFEARIQEKKAKIRSGELVLQRELTGDLAKLPRELRLLILEEALKEEDEVVVFRRSYLKGMCLVAGYYKEAIQVYFAVNNAWKITNHKVAERFMRTIQLWGVENKIQYLYLSHYGRDDKCDPVYDDHTEISSTRHNRDFDLVEMCPRLEKLKLTLWVSNAQYRPYQDQEYNIPLDVDIVMSDLDFHKLFEWTHIKVLDIEGMNDNWFWEWAAGPVRQGLVNLRTHLQEQFEERKMDVKLDFNIYA